MLKAVTYRATWRTFRPQTQNFSLKKFLIFSRKKFREMELSNPKVRKNLKLFGPSPQNFSQKNFLYYFLKKPAQKKFLIFSQQTLF